MQHTLARRLLPSLPDVVFIVVLLLALWLGGFLTNRDGDLGWHIAIGRVVLDTGAVPQTDLFSYTEPGRPYVPHEWLAGVIFAATADTVGFSGVALLTATVIALTFAGLTAVMLRRGANALIVLPLVALGVLASVAHWAARPHIFTFLFTLIWSTALEEHRQRGAAGGRPLGRLAWLLPALVVWANTHGGFLLAFVLTGVYLAGALAMWATAPRAERAAHRAQARDLGLLLALAVPVTAINPVGFDLLRFAVDFMLHEGYLRKFIPEWQSPNFNDPLFLPLLALLALALLTSVRRQLVPMFMLMAWAAFALTSFRNIPQFVIICLPFIAPGLEDLLAGAAGRLGHPEAPAALRGLVEGARRAGARVTEGARGVRGGIASAVAFVAVAALLAQGVRIDLWRGGYAFSEQAFPVQAIQRMGEFPPGERLFNDASWGGYLSYCCWPRVASFMDGRVDMFGEEYLRDYYRTIEAEPGWEEVLDRHRVDWVMIFPDRPLAQWLERDPNWRETYRDGTTVVFVRAQPEGVASGGATPSSP